MKKTQNLAPSLLPVSDWSIIRETKPHGQIGLVSHPRFFLKVCEVDIVLIRKILQISQLWGIFSKIKPFFLVGAKLQDKIQTLLPPFCSPTFSFMGGIGKN